MLFQPTIAVAILAGLVAAQTAKNTTLDPSTVTPTLRAQWCQGQTNTCGTLCSGDVGNNTCDAATLAFSCTCAANNSAPGLQYYKETMPTFICEKIFDNCIQAGENDQAAQALCKTNEAKNCGHLDPANFTSAATTSASATATSSGAATGTGAAASTSTSKAAAATMAAVRTFGSGAIAVGAAAAFGFLL